MAPTSTAVFRAVADFASLNREVGKTRAEIEKLQKQAGQTTNFDRFDAALTKTAASQEKLRKETDALATSQGKLGRSSGISNLSAAMDKLAIAQEKARVATTAMSAAQSRQQTLLGDSRAQMVSLADAARKVGDAEDKATKSAIGHTKALGDERSAATSKVNALNQLADGLKRIQERDDAAVQSSKGHVEQLYKSVAASKVSADQHKATAASTTEAGRAAKIAGGDYDLLRESMARLGPMAAAIGSGFSSAADSTRRSGEASRSASSDHQQLGQVLGGIGQQYASASRSATEHANSTRRVSEEARTGSGSVANYSRSLSGLSSSANDSARSSGLLNAALNPLKSGLSNAGVAGQGLKTVLLGLSFAGAVPGIQLLVGGLASLVAGLVSVVAAAGPAVGVLAALGPAAIAAAGGIGTAMVSFRGVGDALKAMTALDKEGASAGGATAAARVAQAKAIGAAQRGLRDAVQSQQDAERAGARAIGDAQRSVQSAREDAASGAIAAARRVTDAQADVARAERDAADAAVDAARRVRDAQEDYVRASQRVLDAEADLHNARRQAIRDLEDMQERVTDNVLSQEGAEISLLRAQERLQEVNADATASMLDRREAALRVAEAQDRLSDVQRQSTRDTTDWTAAQQAGVDGMPGVVGAQKSLSGALDSQSKAAESVALAQQAASRSQTDSAERVAAAQQNLSDAQTAQAKQQQESSQKVADAERNLAEAREDASRRARDAAERVADAQLALAEANAKSAESGGAASAAARNLAAAWEKLGPQGRALVNLIHDELMPELDKMTKAGQEAFFPGLIAAIKTLMPLVDSVLIPSITAYGTVLGEVSKRIANEIKSWEGDLQAFGTGPGPDMVNKFGDILVNLLSAMEDVGVAAVPLTNWLFDLGVKLSAYWKDSAEAGRKTGDLGRAFEQVRRTLELLGDILFNVGGILKEVFYAAFPAGDRMLRTFEELTRKTREWMGTTEGKNALKKYFDDAEPNARLILGMLGDIGLAFLKMGASPTLTKLLTAMRDTLGPSLSRFFTAMEQALARMGPQLVDILAGVLDIFSTLMESGSGGGIATFLAVIGGLVDVLNALISIPIVPWIVGMLAAWKGASVAAAAIGKLAAVIPGASMANKALGGAAARDDRADSKSGNGSPGAAKNFRQGVAQGLVGDGRGAPQTGTARLGAAIGGGARSAVGAAAGAVAKPFQSSPGKHQASGGGPSPADLGATAKAADAASGALHRAASAGSGFGSALRSAGATAAAGLGTVVGAADRVAGSVLTGARNTADGIGAAYAGAGRQVGAGMVPAVREAQSASTQIKNGFASSAAAVGGAYDGAKAKTGAAFQSMGASAKSIAADTAFGFKSAADKIGASWAGAGKQIGAGMLPAVQAAERTSQGIRGHFDSAATRVGAAFSGVASQTGKLLAPITSTAKSVADSTVVGFKSAADRIGAAYAGTGKQVGAGMLPAATAAESTSGRIRSSFSDAAARVGTAFSGAATAVGGALAPIATKARDVADSTAVGFKSATDRIAGMWVGAAAGSGVMTDATGKVSKSATDMGDSVERSGARAGGAFSRVGDAVRGAVSTITGHFSSLGGAAKRAADDVEAAGSRAKGAGDKFSGVGDAARRSGERMGGLQGAAGGLVGFLGGPWGVAITGAVLGLGFLADAQQKAADRAAAHKQALADFREALVTSNGAIDANVRKAADAAMSNHELRQSGIGLKDGLDSLGISQEDFNRAITEGGKPLEDIRARLGNVSNEHLRMVDTNAETGQVRYIYDEIGLKARDLDEAIVGLAGGFDTAAAAALRDRANLNGVNIETQRAIDLTTIHSDNLLNSLSSDLAKQQSLLSIKDAQKNYNDAVAQYGPTSDQAQQASVTLQQQMLNYMNQAADTAEKQATLNNETFTAKDRMDASNKAALELAATHKGPLPEALQKVISGMSGTELAAQNATVKIDATGQAIINVPGHKPIVLTDNSAETIAHFRAVQRELDLIQAEKDIHLRFSSGQATQEDYARLKTDFPAGGGIVPGYAPGKDIVPAVLSPGEAVLVPELVKKIGAKNILRANRLASNGRSAATFGTSQMHYAGGGIVPSRRKKRATTGASTRAAATPTAPVVRPAAPVAAPAPVGPVVDAAATKEAAAAVSVLQSSLSALGPTLSSTVKAGQSLVTGALSPLAASLNQTLVGATSRLRTAGLLPLRSDLQLTAAQTQLATQAMTAAMSSHDQQALASLQTLRASGLLPYRSDLTATQAHEQATTAAMTAAMNTHRDMTTSATKAIQQTGLLPLRTDLTATQTHEQATTTAMTAAMNTHRDMSNLATKTVQTAGLLPLRTDLTATQAHEAVTTTAMSNSMNLHRDVSNAATLAVRTAGLLPYRTDLGNTQANTALQTTMMSSQTETFKDRATLALGQTRDGLNLTSIAATNTQQWWAGRMSQMQTDAANPIRAVITGPFNQGIIKAWNSLDAQFALGKHVPDVVPGFATGGKVPGTGNGDTVPAMLTPGEFVLSKKAIAAMGGLPNVERMHQMARAGIIGPNQNLGQGKSDAAERQRLMRTVAIDDLPLNFAYGGVAPHVAFAGDEVNRLFGPLPGGIGGVGARGNVSDHPRGFALDFMTMSNQGLGDKIASHLVANAQRLAVKYLIWKQQINSGSGWSGMEDRGSITANHFDHVHTSFTDSATGGRAFSGAGAMFDPGPVVDQAFADTFSQIGAMRAGASPHTNMMLDIAQQAADAVKGKAMDAVRATFAVGLGGVGGGAVGSADVVAQVRGVAARYGWGQGAEWDALSALIAKESSWNPNAANPTSSARGLFQKMTSVHGPVEPTAAGQAEWGLNYIRGRYGSPSAAWRFHTANNYYARGGLVPGTGNGDTEPAMLTPGEFVIRKDAVQAIGMQKLNALNAAKPGAFSPNAVQHMALGGVVQRQDGPAYQIRRGDALSRIALAYGTTISELQRLNNISNPNRIYAGAWLKLPSRPTPGSAASPGTSIDRYQIQRNDTLTALAKRFGTTIQELQRLNNISNPDKIYTGAWLNYPKKNAPPAKPAPAPTPTAPAAPAGVLEAYGAGIEATTKDTREFESNLLTLTRWGYSDLATALAKMGMKSTGGTGDNGGGLALSREAIKSPSAAAKVNAIVKDSQNILGADLETVLSVVGALQKTAGRGVRDVAQATNIDTKDIFKAVGTDRALAEIAKLPPANKDKFLSNMDAYKRGLPFASGGKVGGAGNRDTVPAMLTPGEFVIRKDAAKAIGVGTLHRLNNADKLGTQKFATGGPVMDAASMFSLGGPVVLPSVSSVGAVQKAVASSVSNIDNTTSHAKSVIFEEGSVQVHNAEPQRATDSFGSVMQKLSWSGTFS